ncbi:T9SS C-terminal target domain-containing protein [Flavobacterium arcticum]|uniref:T9SS C-terminal target domain-containing protein n=1 Tax=Flavobacterium arcticum TaxID=1784713 RepID=A0A345H874_9FLAO|nr:T9SS sorting signal type C domain-containing protein [Flavobacterium arcticum]AXG72784.1 T9SS C-terminal target domain-containing protein [Flavobacterium arcticum]KAF2510946.1 T9SS sorting signal type C domain-containing protein [Flavobacterium arcticum]
MLKKSLFRKILFSAALFLSGVTVWGQTDDFTDGNFTSNPTWLGDTSFFTVITDGVVPEGSATTDGSFLAASVNQGNITLMTASTEVSEWEFSLATGDFNPSNSNYIAVVLMSDVAFSGDIAAAEWSGYYLELGVTGSSDKIELWKKPGAGEAIELGELSTTSYGNGALEAGLNIRITRSESGEWQLYTSEGFTYDATPTIAAGSTITDNTYTASSYFGVAQHFTSTSQASRRVYIDNISLGGDVALTTPVTTAATYTSSASFTANWGLVVAATSYRLDVSATSDFSTYVTGYEDLNVGSVTSYEVTGLNPETDYYYRVRAVSDSDTSEDSNIIMLTTGIENVWDGAVWTAGFVPSVIDKAIIEGAYNTATEGEFTSSTMLINPGGSVVIASGTNLIVANEINNTQSAAAFIIENNANLIQTNPNAVNSVALQVQKNSSPLYRLDYSLWSAPVTGQNLLAFSPQTLTNRFYDYDESTDLYTAIAPGANSFKPGYGYLIRTPNNHVDFVDEETPGEVWTGIFEGEVNNGTITVPMETALNGYNLVGNPYPSPINIAAFYAANTGVIDEGSALYFWRKRNDPDATTYATITLAAYTANEAAGGDTGSSTFIGDSDDWVINPGQGFFVQATAGSLAFNNAMRMPVNNGQFFRVEQQVQKSSRIWLNLTTEGEFSQMSIVYNPDMTLGLDYGWDGKMLLVGNPVELYTIANDVNLTVQARPEFAITDSVAVGFYAERAGNYTISLDHVDGLFTEGQDIYLIDYVTGQLINLNDRGYSFTTQAGTNNNRFAIVYNQAYLSTKNSGFNPNEVVVYQTNNDINIDAGTLDITAVNVYDMRGRTLYTNNNVNASQLIVSNLNSDQQVLIVNVTTNRGTVTKKVVY